MGTLLVNTGAWLALLLLATQLAAQEKIETPSQKTKEAVEKLLRAPTAVRKSLQTITENAQAQLKEAATESSSANRSPAPSLANKSAADEELRISPAIKRDPFQPYSLNTRNTPRRRENLSPLERYELGQLKLVGVVWDLREPTAMVEDSAGLGYIVRVGTPIGPDEGKVKSIKPNGITIEEFFVDLYGAKKRREVPMKLVAEMAE